MKLLSFAHLLEGVIFLYAVRETLIFSFTGGDRLGLWVDGCVDGRQAMC